MFAAALFTIAEIWKQPMYTDRGIKKKVTYIHIKNFAV